MALARALAPRPPILLMDEPFSGLDNRLRDGIRDQTLDILKEEGTAVLLVTHEPEEAMRMADRIALMREGRIVQQGAPYNIYNNPVDRDAAQFFSDVNVIHGVVENCARPTTPFGQFLTPGLADRADVEIIIRPQHLKMDFDRNGTGPAADPGRRRPGARPGGAGALRRQPVDRRADDGPRRLGAEGDDPRACSCRGPARRSGCRCAATAASSSPAASRACSRTRIPT